MSEARAILSWRRVMAREEVNGSLHFDRAIGFYWQAIGKAEQARCIASAHGSGVNLLTYGERKWTTF